MSLSLSLSVWESREKLAAISILGLESLTSRHPWKRDFLKESFPPLEGLPSELILGERIVRTIVPRISFLSIRYWSLANFHETWETLFRWNKINLNLRCALPLGSWGSRLNEVYENIVISGKPFLRYFSEKCRSNLFLPSIILFSNKLSEFPENISES